MRYLVGFLFLLGAFAPLAHAQTQDTDQQNDQITYILATVTNIESAQVEQLPGTETSELYQTIDVTLDQGPEVGKVVELTNDYIELKVGDRLYVRHEVDPQDSIDAYSVGEPYRIPTLEFFVGLFVVCLLVFGGWQGFRGLVSLILSLGFITYFLLPGILAGYNPVLVAMGVSALIIVLGSYITHGFSRMTSSAVVGMLVTILLTGGLAYLAIHWGHFTGYTSDEAVDLNFDTTGSINFVGLLLGSLMIGLLGVLYDAAISQAVAVEELLRMSEGASRRKVFARAMRIGREHIGALVNILAIAYVGASLPLLLLFKLTNNEPFLTVVNQEIFATEIIRTMIGSLGLILAVPVTTLVAVYMLYGKRKAPHREDGERRHVHMH